MPRLTDIVVMDVNPDMNTDSDVQCPIAIISMVIIPVWTVPITI